MSVVTRLRQVNVEVDRDLAFPCIDGHVGTIFPEQHLAARLVISLVAVGPFLLGQLVQLLVHHFAGVGLGGVTFQLCHETLLSLAFCQANLGLSYFVGVFIHGFAISLGDELQRVVRKLVDRASGLFY